MQGTLSRGTADISVEDLQAASGWTNRPYVLGRRALWGCPISLLCVS
jgi:hypothetical protein